VLGPSSCDQRRDLVGIVEFLGFKMPRNDPRELRERRIEFGVGDAILGIRL